MSHHQSGHIYNHHGPHDDQDPRYPNENITHHPYPLPNPSVNVNISTTPPVMMSNPQMHPGVHPVTHPAQQNIQQPHQGHQYVIYPNTAVVVPANIHYQPAGTYQTYYPSTPVYTGPPAISVRNVVNPTPGTHQPPHFNPPGSHIQSPPEMIRTINQVNMIRPPKLRMGPNAVLDIVNPKTGKNIAESIYQDVTEEGGRSPQPQDQNEAADLPCQAGDNFQCPTSSNNYQNTVTQSRNQSHTSRKRSYRHTRQSTNATNTQTCNTYQHNYQQNIAVNPQYHTSQVVHQQMPPPAFYGQALPNHQFQPPPVAASSGLYNVPLSNQSSNYGVSHQQQAPHISYPQATAFSQPQHFPANNQGSNTSHYPHGYPPNTHERISHGSYQSSIPETYQQSTATNDQRELATSNREPIHTSSNQQPLYTNSSHNLSVSSQTNVPVSIHQKPVPLHNYDSTVPTCGYQFLSASDVNQTVTTTSHHNVGSHSNDQQTVTTSSHTHVIPHSSQSTALQPNVPSQRVSPHNKHRDNFPQDNRKSISPSKSSVNSNESFSPSKLSQDTTPTPNFPPISVPNNEQSGSVQSNQQRSSIPRNNSSSTSESNYQASSYQHNNNQSTGQYHYNQGKRTGAYPKSTRNSNRASFSGEYNRENPPVTVSSRQSPTTILKHSVETKPQNKVEYNKSHGSGQDNTRSQNVHLQNTMSYPPRSFNPNMTRMPQYPQSQPPRPMNPRQQSYQRFEKKRNLSSYNSSARGTNTQSYNTETARKPSPTYQNVSELTNLQIPAINQKDITNNKFLDRPVQDPVKPEENIPQPSSLNWADDSEVEKILENTVTNPTEKLLQQDNQHKSDSGNDSTKFESSKKLTQNVANKQINQRSRQNSPTNSSRKHSPLDRFSPAGSSVDISHQEYKQRNQSNKHTAAKPPAVTNVESSTKEINQSSDQNIRPSESTLDDTISPLQSRANSYTENQVHPVNQRKDRIQKLQKAPSVVINQQENEQNQLKEVTPSTSIDHVDSFGPKTSDSSTIKNIKKDSHMSVESKDSLVKSEKPNESKSKMSYSSVVTASIKSTSVPVSNDSKDKKDSNKITKTQDETPKSSHFSSNLNQRQQPSPKNVVEKPGKKSKSKTPHSIVRKGIVMNMNDELLDVPKEFQKGVQKQVLDNTQEVSSKVAKKSSKDTQQEPVKEVQKQVSDNTHGVSSSKVSKKSSKETQQVPVNKAQKQILDTTQEVSSKVSKKSSKETQQKPVNKTQKQVLDNTQEGSSTKVSKKSLKETQQEPVNEVQDSDQTLSVSSNIPQFITTKVQQLPVKEIPKRVMTDSERELLSSISRMYLNDPSQIPVIIEDQKGLIETERGPSGYTDNELMDMYLEDFSDNREEITSTTTQNQVQGNRTQYTAVNVVQASLALSDPELVEAFLSETFTFLNPSQINLPNSDNTPNTASAGISETAEVIAEVVVAPQETAEVVSEVVVAPQETAEVVAEVVAAPQETAEVVSEVVVAPQETAEVVAEVVVVPQETAEVVAEVVVAPQETAEVVDAPQETAEENTEVVVALQETTEESESTDVTEYHSQAASVTNETTSDDADPKVDNTSDSAGDETEEMTKIVCQKNEKNLHQFNEPDCSRDIPIQIIPDYNLSGSTESNFGIDDNVEKVEVIISEEILSASNQNSFKKNQYSRQFLMALKNSPHSQIRPANLPDMDVIKHKSKQKIKDSTPVNLRSFPEPSRIPEYFIPSASRSFSSRVALPSRKSNSGSKSKPSEPQMIHLKLSLSEDVALRRTKNAWKPSCTLTTNTSVADDEGKTELLFKKFRSVLNKLTPEKFDKLVGQVRVLEIDTLQKLQGVIKIVFEKAIDEPTFNKSYALMCSELSSIKVDGVANEDTKNSTGINFRKLLLTRCQSEFEDIAQEEAKKEKKLAELQRCTDSEKKKELQSILEDSDSKIRKRSVGVVKFIGELFKLGMLTYKIMIECIDTLLKTPDEERLECLCKLLATIGRLFEEKLSLSEYIERLKSLTTQKKKLKISSRIRFMIQDVIDLRCNNWIPRHNDTNPKTMDQIKKDIENERINTNILLNTPQEMNRRHDRTTPHNSYRQQDDRITPQNISRKEDRFTPQGTYHQRDYSDNRRRNSSRPSSKPDSEGWSPSKSRSKLSLKIQTNKLALNPQADDNHVFGSRQNYMWKSSTPSLHTPTITSNPFSLLDTPNVPIDRDRMSVNIAGSRSAGSKEYRGNSSWNGRNPHNSSRHQSSDSSCLRRESLSLNKIFSPNVQDPKNTFQPAFKVPSSVPLLPIPLSRSRSSSNSSIVSNKPQKTEKDMLKVFNELVENCSNPTSTKAFINDIQEILEDSFDSSSFPLFFQETIGVVFERPLSVRQRYSSLISHMIEKKFTSLSLFQTEYQQLLETAEDLVIDFPLCWTYFAEVLSDMLMSDIHPFVELKQTLSTLKNTENCGKLLKELITNLESSKGFEWLADKWNKSGLIWSDFFDGEREPVDDIIKKYKLDLFTDACSNFVRTASAHELSFDEIQNNLIKLLREDNFDNTVSWISINIGAKSQLPQFTKNLVTSILKVSIEKRDTSWKLNEDIFIKLLRFIRRYVDADALLELQCLYAIQAYIHELQHPQGVLAHIIDILYRESIIADETFFDWQKSTDPAEIQGHAIAILAVASFFRNLSSPPANDESGDET